MGLERVPASVLEVVLVHYSVVVAEVADCSFEAPALVVAQAV